MRLNFQGLNKLRRVAWTLLALLLLCAPSLTFARLATPTLNAPSFATRRLDPTGFYYFGGRYYDPATGRFLSPDPSRFADSRNLYAYCANDPVNGYDPDGMLETQLHNEQQPASAALPSASNPISSATPSWSYAPDPTADGRYGYVNRTQGGAAATLLALGDMLGVTTAYEAMTGRNLSSGQWLTGAEQRQSGLMAVVSLATLAMPAVALESRAGVGVGSLEARAAMATETEAAGAEMRATAVAAETSFYVRADGVAIPATGYRALGGAGVEEAMSGVIAPRSYPGTYVTFDNITGMSRSGVRSLLQLPRTPTHVASFDTLQIVDDLRIPREYRGEGLSPEPITVSYPKLGVGQGSQAVVTRPIVVNPNNVWPLSP